MRGEVDSFAFDSKINHIDENTINGNSLSPYLP